MSPAFTQPIRRFAPGFLTAVTLLAVAATPATAAAKKHHHAHRAAAPTRACSPDEMATVGSGASKRLFVCDAAGRWTEAVFAETDQHGHTHIVGAGRI